MSGCIALVVAAGRGARFGGDVPKQYRLLGGRPVLRHCLSTFCNHPGITGVRAVIHPDDRARYDAAAAGLTLLDPVPGGASRQESVRLGLESLENNAPALVLIHDAARPFVDNGSVTRALEALATSPGALVATPVVDTLKRAGGDRDAPFVGETIDRAGLWRAQTPQGFRYPDILAAHRAAQQDGAGAGLTDDAAVAERAGMAIALIMGSEDNFKVTSEEDLARAERILAAGHDIRTGNGFDVHAFGPGDHAWLCGIRVPHGRGLLGHSDADVGLHALTDAILGAIGDGDIGVHFPDSDPEWRGASSDRFLAHAGKLVAARGGAILNVDITLICQEPRIGPHREAMVARVAEILGLAQSRVSLKATTTEGLGFTGRGEGIAAQAVATVRLPPHIDDGGR
jgi:2-C-methyl-D-erythritol 4-phosphate cytidylyltransferase/2-C-methyl-D-erythritol 2,4-cyclodiphosphate synthase